LLRHRAGRGVTNAELACIALKYTSRISDLRDAGWRILCTCEDATKGVFRYHLLGRAASRQRELFFTEDSQMEKLGVDEDPARVVAAQDQQLCPWCGAALVSVDETNVLKCPVHGTAPFEPGTTPPQEG
jgi:hypothetical protein